MLDKVNIWSRKKRPDLCCPRKAVNFRFSLGERSEPVLVNSMSILFVCMFIGRAQRARTSGNFVCMYVCMSSTDRGQCACVPAQRANVAGLASSARCARPQMSSTDRSQCACVTAQRANVAGLASSARCARSQMLCILLVICTRVNDDLHLRSYTNPFTSFSLSRDIWSGVKSGPWVQFLPAKSCTLIQKLVAVSK